MENIFNTIFEMRIQGNVNWLMHVCFVIQTYSKKRISLRQDMKHQNLNELFMLAKSSTKEVQIKKGKSRQQFDLNLKEHYDSFCRHFLKNCIRKYPKEFTFKVMYAYFNLTNMKSYMEVANYIHILTGEQMMSMQQKVILLGLRSLLSKEIIIAEDNLEVTDKINVKKYMIVTESADQLKDLVNDQAKKQIKFWEIYLRPTIPFWQLLTLSGQIEEDKIKITKFWKKMEGLNEKKFYPPYIVYGVYLSLINNKPSESYQFLSSAITAQFKIGSDESELTDRTIFDSDTGKLIVSASKESLGIIKECNESFLDKFTYTKQEVEGINIKVLLSNFYCDFHDKAILKYLKRGRTNKLNKTCRVFMKNGQGHLITAMMHVKLNPLLQYGLNFVALFRSIKKTSGEPILIKSNGTIDGMSQGLSEILQISPSVAVQTLIQEICPGFRLAFDLIKRFQDTKSKTKEDLLRIEFNDDELNASSKRDLTVPDPNMDTEAFLNNQGLAIQTHNNIDRDGLSGMETEKLLLAQSTRGTILQSKLTTDSKRENILGKESSRTMIFGQNNTNNEIETTINQYKETGLKLNFYTKGHASKSLTALVRIEIEDTNFGWALILRVYDLKSTSKDTLGSDFPGSKEGVEKMITVSSNTYETGKRMDKQTSDFFMSDQGFKPVGKGGIIFAKTPVIDEDASALQFQSELEFNDAKKVERYNYFEEPRTEEFKDEDIEMSVREEIPITGDLTPIKQNTAQEGSFKSFKNEKNRSTEDNDLKEKKEENLDLKMNTKILMKKLDNRTTSQSGGASASSTQRINKLIEACVDKMFVQTKYIVFIISFFVVLAVGQGLLIAQTLYVNSSHEQIKNKGDIVLSAYTRADNTDLALLGVRLINVARRGYYGPESVSIYPAFMNWMVTYMQAMISANYLLEQQVASIEPALQQEFYQPLVNLYAVDQNGKIIHDQNETLNAFDAVYKIYVMILKLSKEPMPPVPSTDPDIDYLIANTYNSLMLEFERTVDLTQTEMTNSIDQFQSEMQILAGVAISIISLYLVGSLYIFKKYCDSAEKFTKTFTKVPEEDSKQVLSAIEKFCSGLKNDFKHMDFGTVQAAKKQSKVAKGTNQKKADVKRMNYGRTYLHYFLLIIKLWPVKIILGLAIMINFANSQTGVDKIKQMQAQMVQVIYYMYITDIACFNLVDLVLYNDSTIVRNQPIDKMIKSITLYGGDNEIYIKAFRNPDGSFDASIKKILFNVSCYDTTIITPDYAELCNQLGGGTGVMSLLGTNPLYEKTMQEFANAWLESPRTPDLIPQFMHRFWEYALFFNNFQNLFIVVTQQTVNKAFFGYLSDEKAATTQLVILFSIGIEILAIITFYISVWKIKDQDYKMKTLYRLFPLPLIMRTRILKYYLVETSGKLGETLKKTI